MLRRLARSLAVLVPSRGLKHQVQIPWVRPEYTPAYCAARSGDLEPRPALPPATLGLHYALSDEIADAPESVKKIFSVAHLGSKEYKQLVKQQLTARVRRHAYDENTAETRIARLTAHIRCLQHTMQQAPKNMTAKKAVQELIDKRKKLLKFLRQYDYKRFEWLLERLALEYKAHPASFHKLSRKESLRRLTELHCEGVRDKKLRDYRELLHSQQGPFLRDKLSALRHIRAEQQALQLPLSVAEQDIARVEEQLRRWEQQHEQAQRARRKKSIITQVD